MEERLSGPGHTEETDVRLRVTVINEASMIPGITSIHLEVPDERRDAAVRLVVMFLMRQLLQLGQERDGVPRGEQGQEVRG